MRQGSQSRIYVHACMHAQQNICNVIHDCQEKDHLKTELSFFDLLEAMIQKNCLKWI